MEEERREQERRKQEYERLWNDAPQVKRARPASIVADGKVVSLIRGWLEFCMQNHGQGGPLRCAQRELNQAYPQDEEILLIDVRRLKLYKGLTSHQYVALSYVWGGAVEFSTKEATLDPLMVNNGIELVWKNLPLVIQDAINLTDELQQRYLWVDALCIIQDDDASKHHQLELMAEIYNRATATLIACTGRDANCRLVTAEAAANSQSSHIPTEQHLREKIMKSYHNQRAWTYQERLLSRRRIYFFSDQIIFHCREDILYPIQSLATKRSENSSQDEEKHRESAKPSNSKSADDLKVHNAVGRFQEPRPKGLVWPVNMTAVCWEQGFDFWTSMVQEYSNKVFTYDDDILRACTGILHAFQGYSQWPIFQGMPEPLIEIALMWAPTTIITRRDIMIEGAKDQRNEIFPTWSWLAWKGGIHFELVKEESGFRDFKSCLDASNIPGVGALVNFPKRITRVKRRNITTDPSPNNRWDSEYVSPRLRKTISQDSIHSVDTDGRSAPSVRFSAFTVRASAFKVIQLPERNVKSGFDTSHWTWLTDESRRICGVMYGLEKEQANMFQSPTVHDIILLSKIRQSAYQIVNQAFAPDIAMRLLHHLGAVDLTVTPGPSDDFFSGLFNRNPSKIPFGTIVNVMLVERRKSRMDYYVRVAVGQIVGGAWENANPQQREIILR